MTRDDLGRVLDDVRFVELSCHPELREPWALGMRLHPEAGITWVFGMRRDDVVLKAQIAIELLGNGPMRKACAS